jgi:putative tryptophan/tyrosine transport system substrate-binding protein
VRRRDFITLLSATATAWPFAARGQQPPKVPLIGFIGTVAPATWTEQTAAFERRLSELHWVPGRTITIDYRWMEGRNEKAREIADEFVARKVDIIVAGGNAVAAAKQATTAIPIVFPLAVDPVGSGLVDNLSHPGGNVTGLSLQGPDAAGKRIELLRDVVPNLRHVAVMADATYPAAKNELAETQAACRALGIETIALEIKKAEDIAPAFDTLRDRAEALYIVADALTNTNYPDIATRALAARLPTICATPRFIDNGGLLGYGPNVTALFIRTADYVDKILRGTKPGDIPVEQPTTFELAVNLAIAKKLGISVPHNLLVLADKVIE